MNLKARLERLEGKNLKMIYAATQCKTGETAEQALARLKTERPDANYCVVTNIKLVDSTYMGPGVTVRHFDEETQRFRE